MTLARPEYPVFILMYHGVNRIPLKVFDWCFIEETVFQAQVHYLKSSFDVAPLAHLPALLSQGAWRPTVAVTFDDGFLSTYEVAFPILRRASIPATVFVCTDFIDSDETLWYCRLNRALTRTYLKSFEWNGTCYDLAAPDARAASSALLQDQLKHLGPDDLMDSLQAIIRSLGIKQEPPLEASSPYRMLTREAVLRMQQSQLIEFGAHTKTHAILRHLSTTQRREEIEGSIRDVEELTGRRCRLFAYPNGQVYDYDYECVDMLAAAGIGAAVTTVSGFNDVATPPLELKRIGIGGDVSIEKFKQMLEGAPEWTV